MICPFNPGDTKMHAHTVTTEDFARFETGEVHQVYSTFALARDAEWSGRLFVLEMKEIDEEGIGTGLTIEHLSPALENEEVLFSSMFMEVKGNEVITSYKACVQERVIATGIQKQKIIKKDRLTKLFAALNS